MATGGHHGPVDVLYAGSLVALIEKQITAGFHTATGYTLSGFSGGSKDLAADISGKVRQGDVFISASPKVDASLEGPAHGSWVSWYATFATSKLVLGYNPHSRFAAQLRTKPWYEVVSQPGFLLGLTDPATDPKGELAVKALDGAASDHHLPALEALGTSSKGIFPEPTLVGRLQSGQLDAGFFYAAEASASGIATVPLTGTDLKATYTVTILNRAPHAAAADAFVDYLLGSSGTAALSHDGFVLVAPPKVTGHGVPAGVRSVIPSP